MAYRLKAGVDFDHCEKGLCKNCSAAQRRQCEEETPRQKEEPEHVFYPNEPQRTYPAEDY